MRGKINQALIRKIKIVAATAKGKTTVPQIKVPITNMSRLIPAANGARVAHDRTRLEMLHVQPSQSRMLTLS